MRFGLFAVDYQTQERTLREGARPFIDAIRRSKAAAAGGAGSTP